MSARSRRQFLLLQLDFVFQHLLEAFLLVVFLFGNNSLAIVLDLPKREVVGMKYITIHDTGVRTLSVAAN